METEVGGEAGTSQSQSRRKKGHNYYDEHLFNRLR